MLTPNPHCPHRRCLPYSPRSSRDCNALLSSSGLTGALMMAVIVIRETIHANDVRAARATRRRADAANVKTRICLIRPVLSVSAPHKGVKRNVIAGVMAPKCPIRLSIAQKEAFMIAGKWQGGRQTSKAQGRMEGM